MRNSRREREGGREGGGRRIGREGEVGGKVERWREKRLINASLYYLKDLCLILWS